MEDTENQDLSWLPVLKLNLAMTNSKGLTLRNAGRTTNKRDKDWESSAP
jgi:hypothetical protein